MIKYILLIIATGLSITGAVMQDWVLVVIGIFFFVVFFMYIVILYLKLISDSIIFMIKRFTNELRRFKKGNKGK